MVAQIGLTDTHTTISQWTQSCHYYTLLFHDSHAHLSNRIPANIIIYLSVIYPRKLTQSLSETLSPLLEKFQTVEWSEIQQQTKVKAMDLSASSEIRLVTTLGSWCEFGRCDDANAWRKSTKEADNTQNFLLQFRK